MVLLYLLQPFPLPHPLPLVNRPASMCLEPQEETQAVPGRVCKLHQRSALNPHCWTCETTALPPVLLLVWTLWLICVFYLFYFQMQSPLNSPCHGKEECGKGWPKCSMAAQVLQGTVQADFLFFPWTLQLQCMRGIGSWGATVSFDEARRNIRSN